MELTSKQRAQLRGLANGLDTILQIGKEGIGDNLVQQANEALEARCWRAPCSPPGRPARPWPG